MSGRQLLRAVLVLAVLASCRSADSEVLLSVSAPKSWLGATVELDGEEVAELSEMMSNTGLIGAILCKLRPRSPLQDLVAVNLPLVSWGLEAGPHEVVVRGSSGARQALRFEYPFREGSTHCLVFVNESDVVVGDECAVEQLAS